MANQLTRRVLSLILLLAAAVPAVAADDMSPAGRVVALSDIHGAYEALVETLGATGLVDEQHAWSGGTARLVIVGDIVDRGPRSRDVMDLLMRLEPEAAAAGGEVRVLIGNHESMNMIGDMRYVSREEYAAFAADETDAQRDRWFAAYAERAGSGSDDAALRERFDATYPPGFFALRAAFGPDGKYGRWLLDKPVIAVIDGTAFVHGGLSPLVAEVGLDSVNGDLRRELAAYVRAVDTLMDAGVLLPTDNYYDHENIVNDHLPSLGEAPEVTAAIEVVRELSDAALFMPDGPLWYRGNVACSAIVELPRLHAALQAIGADRVVIGHTPTPGRQVLQRFGGKVVEVDTGMLRTYYKGSGHAVVFEDGKLTVYNQAAGDIGPPPEHPRQVGSRPGNLSAAALESLLQGGEIVAGPTDDAAGRVIVSVSDGEQTVSAIFNERKSRGFYPDVAAYRLDRLLGLDMVPVTVVRSVGNNEGSLQFLPAKLADEGQRAAAGRGGSASCPLPVQWQAMYVFDVLVYNESRGLQSMVYEPGAWSLMSIAHRRAFGTGKGRPPHLANVDLEVSSAWHSALQGLTDAVLDEHLADVLDKRRLRALAARRDQLLSN